MGTGNELCQHAEAFVADLVESGDGDALASLVRSIKPHFASGEVPRGMIYLYHKLDDLVDPGRHVSPFLQTRREMFACIVRGWSFWKSHQEKECGLEAFEFLARASVSPERKLDPEVEKIYSDCVAEVVRAWLSHKDHARRHVTEKEYFKNLKAWIYLPNVPEKMRRAMIRHYWKHAPTDQFLESAKDKIERRFPLVTYNELTQESRREVRDFIIAIEEVDTHLQRLVRALPVLAHTTIRSSAREACKGRIEVFFALIQSQMAFYGIVRRVKDLIDKEGQKIKTCKLFSIELLFSDPDHKTGEVLEFGGKSAENENAVDQESGASF